jgi:hypothetical protein
MENVVIERLFDQSVALSAVDELYRAQRRCMEDNRVAPSHSYLSADGTRLVCVLRAPDAEAVRRVARQIKDVPQGRAWSASILDPPAPPARVIDADLLPRIVVERTFDEPVAFEKLEALEEEGRWCLDLHRVEYLRSYFAVDRRRMLCVYRAPDADSVRRAQRQIGLPFDRAWPATVSRRQPT